MRHGLIGLAKKDSDRFLASSQPLIGPAPLRATKTRSPMRGHELMISIASDDSGTAWPFPVLVSVPASFQVLPLMSDHLRLATSPRRWPQINKSRNAAPNG